MLVTIAAVVLVRLQPGSLVEPVDKPATQSTQKQATSDLGPQPSGKVDDTTSAFSEQLVAESQLLQNEEVNASLVTADSNDLNGFGQSINENDY